MPITTILILIILAISLYALHLRGELTYRLSDIRNLQNIIHKHGIQLKYDDEFGFFYDVAELENKKGD